MNRSNNSSITLAALEKERAANIDLRDQLEAAKTMEDGHRNAENTAEIIPRPSGTAGTHFSIQVAMGLVGTGGKYEKYKAIQVGPMLNLKVVENNLQPQTLETGA